MYRTKELPYASSTGGCDCSASRCTPPMYCNGSVSFTQNGCGITAILVSSMSAPGCMSATPSGISHAAYYPAHQCMPSMSVLTGSVTPQGTTTFCCTP